MPDPIIIVPYDSAWPERFLALGTALREGLGEVALRIDHIGSTAIPGLAAKPIIDLQISVASFEPLAAYRGPIENLGFIWRENNPDLTKRYFREKPGNRRTHIHLRRAGSWAEQIALLFRDYLRSHPAEAGRYAELKQRLAEQYRHDRQGYTHSKSHFVWDIMIAANRWTQETGWQPGPSDV